MTECDKMLKRVQMYGFACLEAHLFLNTHPRNRQALDYYRKMSMLYRQARDEYIKKCGPLRASDVSDDAQMWEWIKGPWPWMTDSEGER